MFMGEYSHNIDAKGRLIIPAKFREELGTKMIVTQGLDGCLSIYTLDAWAKIYASLQALPSTKREARAYVRILTSRACDVELDNQGRILIPSKLLQIAAIKKECIVVGAGEKVELWNKELWEAYMEDFDYDSGLEELAESLTDFML